MSARFIAATNNTVEAIRKAWALKKNLTPTGTNRSIMSVGNNGDIPYTGMFQCSMIEKTSAPGVVTGYEIEVANGIPDRYSSTVGDIYVGSAKINTDLSPRTYPVTCTSSNYWFVWYKLEYDKEKSFISTIEVTNTDYTDGHHYHGLYDKIVYIMLAKFIHDKLYQIQLGPIRITDRWYYVNRKEK